MGGQDQLPRRSVILQLQGDSLQWEAGHNDLKELILMQERAPTSGPLSLV